MKWSQITPIMQLILSLQRLQIPITSLYYVSGFNWKQIVVLLFSCI